MKTKYKYIYFEEHKEPILKRAVWTCYNKRGKYPLGFCEFHDTWKEWEFCPEPNMGFTIECLNDIAHFIGQLNEQTAAKP